MSALPVFPPPAPLVPKISLTLVASCAVLVRLARIGVG